MLSARSLAPVLLVCACTTRPALAPAPVPVVTAAQPAPTPPPTRFTAAPTSERCVTGPAGRIELLPSQATLVAGVDVGAVLSSQLYAENRVSVETEPNRALIDAASACGIGLGQWRRVTLGSDLLGGQVAIVLTVDGIGDGDTLGCFGTAFAKQQNAKPWTRVERGGPAKYTTPEGGAIWAVDGCTAVFASSKWIEPVEQLVAGQGGSVRGGALEAAIGRTAVTQPVWLATTSAGTMLPGSMFAEARDVSASVELATGLALSMSLRFDQASTAVRKADELRMQIPAFSGMFTALGVPEHVVERAQVGTQGDLVTLAGGMDHGELHELRKSQTK